MSKIIDQFLTANLREIKYGQRDSSCTSGVRYRQWTLGPGPCGKTVLGLAATLETDGLTILQYCSGQPRPDVFFVPMGQIGTTIQMFPVD